MPRWAELLLFAAITIYLGIGVCFAILPFLFGAWKVAAIMLIGWPVIFLK